MKIVRMDESGSFDSPYRFTVVLAPKKRRDLTMIGLLLRLSRQRTLWLCLVMRPYIKGSAEFLRGA